MELSLVNADYASYKLQSAKIKESKDGSTKYVVAEFKPDGMDEMMRQLANGINLQIMAKYGAEAEERDAYLQLWVDKVKEGYTVNIGSYEIGGFNDFWRKDADGKWLTSTATVNGETKKVRTRFKSVIIYWFCDEDGKPIRGMNYITRRAESLYNNSTRIFDVEKTKAADAKKKAAAEAAKKTASDLIGDAEAGDDED